MAATQLLINQIKQTLTDISSDKVTIRTKALDNFNNLVDNRSDDVCRVLNSLVDEDFKWHTVFRELSNAVRDQSYRVDNCRSATSSSQQKNKNDSYKTALAKWVNLANQQAPNISPRIICDVAFECFRTPSIRQSFDLCYLKIVFKHVLDTRFSLDELEVSDWSRKPFFQHFFLKENIKFPHFRRIVVFHFLALQQR